MATPWSSNYDYTGAIADYDFDGEPISTDVDDQNIVANLCLGNIEQNPNWNWNATVIPDEATFCANLSDVLSIENTVATELQGYFYTSNVFFRNSSGSTFYSPCAYLPTQPNTRSCYQDGTWSAMATQYSVLPYNDENWYTDSNGDNYMFIDGTCYTPNLTACTTESVRDYVDSYHISTFSLVSLLTVFVLIYLVIKQFRWF